MVLREKGVDLDRWREELTTNGQPADLKAFGDFLSASYIPNTAIVDCTASDAPAGMYLEWMNKVGHIITVDYVLHL